MSYKFWNYFTILTTLYVTIKVDHQPNDIILWKVIITSFNINRPICFYPQTNFRLLSMVTKMYISLMLHPRLYNFYTPCIFMLMLAYKTSMEYKLSIDIYVC